MNPIDHKKIPDPPKPPPLRRIYEDVEPTLGATIFLAISIVAFLTLVVYTISITSPVITTGGC